MSKEEFLKIQTCSLKVNIHCDGCKHKVKKILQKIEGVYKTHIDSEHGKVTVSGNVDPATLIKKLAKSCKHAELLGPAKQSPQQINLAQLKNLQLDNGKGSGNNNQKQKGAHQQQQLPKGGGPTQQQLQQLQQQMKGLHDMKLPQLNMPIKEPGGPNPGQNQKVVKFADDDDEFSEEDDEFDNDDGEFDDDMSDDELEDAHGNALKPQAIDNGPKGGLGMMMNGNHHPAMGKGGPSGVNSNGGGAVGGKKGGGGPLPIQMGGMAGGGNLNQTPNHIAASGKKGVGKGDHQMGDGLSNGGKKAGPGAGMIIDGGIQQAMNNIAAARAMQQQQQQIGGGKGMPMNHQIANFQAVQGLPTPPSNGGTGGFKGGSGPEMMQADNPYQQQQQLTAAMMNQQRAMGNERFQPMIYARPPPAVNYMAAPAPYPAYPQYPSYPYPYPPPQSGGGHYDHTFSDENTSSCKIM